MTLTLLTGEKKHKAWERSDEWWANKYRTLFDDSVRKGIGDTKRAEHYANIAIHAGVKYCSKGYLQHEIDDALADTRHMKQRQKRLETVLYLYKAVLVLLATQSPAGIAREFPPNKRYDGAKYEMKDYFYSMQAIREAGGDKSFGGDIDALQTFLMEYDNLSLSLFVIAGLHVVDAMRELEGQPSCIETFVSEQLGEPVRIPKQFIEGKDKAGNTYLYDDQGNCLGRKAKKRKPNWITAVKGGAE